MDDVSTLDFMLNIPDVFQEAGSTSWRLKQKKNEVLLDVG